MKPRLIGAILVGAAVAAWACKGDPTAGLRAGPTSLAITPQKLFVDEGSTKSLEVIVRDAQTNPVLLDVTATPVDATVATVAVDTTRPFPDPSRHAFIVSALKPGQTTVHVNGGGLDTSATVSVIPVKFGGTISNTRPAGGSTISIASTSVLKFRPNVAVTFASNIAGSKVSSTADTVKVVVPFSDSGPVKIGPINTTYLGATYTYTVPSTAAVKQTGDFWDGDSSATTAPILSLPAAGGQSAPMITNLFERDNKSLCPDPTAQGPCMFYKFTLADTMNINVSVTWDGAPADSTNLDLFACASPYNAAACVATPEASARTAKRPESFTFNFPAGTHFFVIERLRTGAVALPNVTQAPRNIRVTISRP